MAIGDFEVRVSAGDMRPDPDVGLALPHQWTSDGVVVECDFTGAHLFHLAPAGCVLNDLYREAQDLGIGINGARVTAGGDFDRSSWESTGVLYTIEISSHAPQAALDRLVEIVDRVAEIPMALRAGTTVSRL